MENLKITEAVVKKINQLLKQEDIYRIKPRIYSSDDGFTCRIISGWKGSAFVRKDTDGYIEIPFKGLKSKVFVEAHYERGYHNTDCGWDNTVQIRSKVLSNMLDDLKLFIGDKVTRTSDRTGHEFAVDADHGKTYIEGNIDTLLKNIVRLGVVK